MIDILIVGNLSLDEAVAVARVSPLQLKRILKAGARTTQKVMQQGKRSVGLHESHTFQMVSDQELQCVKSIVDLHVINEVNEEIGKN